jgi:Protein of unknown function (DUF2865)
MFRCLMIGGMLVTRMDTSVALPLCALSASRSVRIQSLVRVLAIAGLIVAGSVSGAKAGGLLEGIFGLFGIQTHQPAYAYSDPNARVDTPGYSSGQKMFCVRLCDGRYYPIASAGNATPVQMCSAMCPASKTRIFRGGEIDYASDSGGARYGDLDQAFAYRTKVVPGCTCNGRDAFGLAPIDVMTDPTLRPGDIVATADGLKAFQGAPGETHRTADFTPPEKSSRVSRDLRDRLSRLRVSEKQ